MMIGVVGAFLVMLTRIAGVLSTETNWTINLPEVLRAQNGLCVMIPCNYTLPKTLNSTQRQEAWYKDDQLFTEVTLNQTDQNSTHRDNISQSQLIGNFSQLQCSLFLNGISDEDNGTYQFIIQLLDQNQTYKSKPLTLITSDLELKPNISASFPMVENKLSVLTCSFLHPCPGMGPSLTWANVSGLNTSSAVNQTDWSNSSELSSTTSLSFLPTAGDHNTTVSCHAHYPVSNAQSSQTFLLDVQYGPRIAPMERSVVILEGHLQTLLCVVDSNPLSNITWSEQGAVLNWSVSDGLNLSIAGMEDTDSRTYTCTAENPIGKANRSVDVLLEYAPRNLSIVGLDNSTVNSSIETVKGNSLSLSCSVESRPSSNLTWRLGGNVRNRSVASNSLWLHLDSISYRDDGIHECVAENPHGKTRQSVKVSLTYSPKEVAVKVSGWRHGIREGDNITLSCFCRSNPPPTNYSWFRVGVDNGTEFVTSSVSLPLGTVTRGQDDVGYYCRAENALGANHSALWQINVEYMPVFSEESQCFREPERVTCVCVATANPSGNLTWHLPRTNLSGNESDGRFVSRRVRDGHLVTGSLILLGPQGEEEVTATCSVRNPHGEAMFKVYLWVKGMDSQLEQLVLGVLAGALGMLLLSLLLCQIFICCRRREKRTPIDATEMQMLTGQRTPVRTLSLVEAEGEVEVEVEADAVEVDPQTEELDLQTEEPQQTTSLRVLGNGEASQEAGEEELELHYACIDFSKANCSDGIVGNRDSTQYAQIKPQ
ncbi:myelin-associated glycoprotein-like isoform X1 [Mustelus asterias]